MVINGLMQDIQDHNFVENYPWFGGKSDGLSRANLGSISGLALTWVIGGITEGDPAKITSVLQVKLSIFSTGS